MCSDNIEKLFNTAVFLPCNDKSVCMIMEIILLFSKIKYRSISHLIALYMSLTPTLPCNFPSVPVDGRQFKLSLRVCRYVLDNLEAAFVPDETD